MSSQAPEKTPPADDQATETGSKTGPKTPVDGQAQEEAGKVREESGGYD